MTINVKAKIYFYTDTTNDGVFAFLDSSDELDDDELELEKLDEFEFCVSAGVAAYLTRSSAEMRS